MNKKIALLILLVLCLPKVKGQGKSHTRLDIETGFMLSPSDAEGLGLLFGIEPKVQVIKNTFAGVKFGFALNGDTYENFNILEYEINTAYDNSLIFFTPTLDYHLNEFAWQGNTFIPYFGLGTGYYLLYNIAVSQIGTDDVFEVDVGNRVGLLLRGGVASGKLRFGLEHTLLPKADIELPNGQVIGTVDNSYWGLLIAYVIGGRKSLRQDKLHYD